MLPQRLNFGWLICLEKPDVSYFIRYNFVFLPVWCSARNVAVSNG